MKFLAISILSLGLFSQAWAQQKAAFDKGASLSLTQQNQLKATSPFKEISSLKAVSPSEGKKFPLTLRETPLKKEIDMKGGGVVNDGGGDNCEPRIQEIRDDIALWIQRGRHSQLRDMTVSPETYAERMQQFLKVTKESDGRLRPETTIACQHHPIEVQGEEKVCRFDLLPQGPKITCYAEAFMNKSLMDEDEQYRLIYHEYAGLAQLEPPFGSQSTYPHSKQISAFLKVQLVKRLAIRSDSKVDLQPYRDAFQKARKLKSIDELLQYLGRSRQDLPIALFAEQNQFDDAYSTSLLIINRAEKELDPTRFIMASGNVKVPNIPDLSTDCWWWSKGTWTGLYDNMEGAYLSTKDGDLALYNKKWISGQLTQTRMRFRIAVDAQNTARYIITVFEMLDKPSLDVSAGNVWIEQSPMTFSVLHLSVASLYEKDNYNWCRSLY